MKLHYIPYLKKYSRKLREEMTDAEKLLWQKIRRRQLHNVQFYRQRPIGKYIVDFVSTSHNVIVEVDGSQHLENDVPRKDQMRDAELMKLGFTIVRYNDNEVFKHTESVLENLYMRLKSLPTSL